MKKMIRSPFFYVGDKYKLMPQIIPHFPDIIDNYIEPFCGGGSSFLNVNANKYLLNDIDSNIIKLHEFLIQYIYKKEDLYELFYKEIDAYGLSCSFRGKTVPEELKKRFIKTYYAKYNKDAYIRLREDFNKDQSNLVKIYLLLIYGFNHFLRFNSKGIFNLPVGNIDFNKNVYNAIEGYLKFAVNKKLEFFNKDFEFFLESTVYTKNDFIYLDPPYLISESEYNKFWNEKEEKRLLYLLDKINQKGIRFALSNVLRHKGKVNQILIDWAKKYRVISIKSNYISYHNNGDKNSEEVLIVNY